MDLLSNIFAGTVAEILAAVTLALFGGGGIFWWYFKSPKPPIHIPKEQEKIKVLVVDDYGQDLSNICNSLLEKKQYQFIMAANVKEAQNVLISKLPKYALIDLGLSGSRKDEFDGIQLFRFISQKQLTTKPIVVSSHSFEITQPHFKKYLKDVVAPNELESVLQEIRDNYIDKLSPYNYVRAITDKLEALENAEKSAK